MTFDKNKDKLNKVLRTLTNLTTDIQEILKNSSN